MDHEQMFIVDNSMMLRGCKKIALFRVGKLVFIPRIIPYTVWNPYITQFPIYFIYMHIYIHYFLLANIRITNHIACILTGFSWSSFWSWFCLYFCNFVYVLMIIFIRVCFPFFLYTVCPLGGLKTYLVFSIFFIKLHSGMFEYPTSIFKLRPIWKFVFFNCEVCPLYHVS